MHSPENLHVELEKLERRSVFFVWRDANGAGVHPSRRVHPGIKVGDAVTCEVWNEDVRLLGLSRFAFDDGIGGLIHQVVEQARLKLTQA
ncbi:hypothetical protein [Deinococcus roseus]|uniref:PilZ domain-containing protein n=1 Tax=Deinococcus roseus TaxID=392414 RepID=A0ABQ2CZR8_9DEIO|nr:hypothetical protein [Deinococcus roseus]GGJ36572.1 hypothetical protein GCM10008938_23400 [Deinococcus roseus]